MRRRPSRRRLFTLGGGTRSGCVEPSTIYEQQSDEEAVGVSYLKSAARESSGLAWPMWKIPHLLRTEIRRGRSPDETDSKSDLQDTLRDARVSILNASKTSTCAWTTPQGVSGARRGVRRTARGPGIGSRVPGRPRKPLRRRARHNSSLSISSSRRTPAATAESTPPEGSPASSHSHRRSRGVGKDDTRGHVRRDGQCPGRLVLAGEHPV